MTLVPCPTCTREVSAEAASCPGCGHPIKPVSAGPLKATPLEQVGCLLPLAIIGAIALLAILFG